VIDSTLPLFRYAESRPVVAPTAPPGIKRAVVAADGVDGLILAAASRHVGEEVAIATLHDEIQRHRQCMQDTVRRRLSDLAGQGYVTLGAGPRLGHVKIEAFHG
jgi:hypothetical protein